MAVLQGTRPRPVALPRSPHVAVGNPTMPRRRTRAVSRARRRPTGVSILLGAIVLLFTAAFFSLSQQVRVSASGYDVDRLSALQSRLEAQSEDLVSELNRLGRAPAIRKQAIGAGLDPLPEPVVIAAR